MRNDIYEMKKDPAKKAEVAKLLVGRSATYPAKLETGKWYTLVVETVGDEMRVTIDGQPAGYLKIPASRTPRSRRSSSAWPAKTAFSTTSRSGTL